jgi:hypothetical protein
MAIASGDADGGTGLTGASGFAQAASRKKENKTHLRIMELLIAQESDWGQLPERQ